MSHNLTQPEEIDFVCTTTAIHEFDAGAFAANRTAANEIDADCIIKGQFNLTATAIHQGEPS